MKKSVYTFGLLASSLVMLTVMPLLNNNNSLSNTAMAQEYDADYYGDNSYSKYPTDDNKYECQTGPLEGFFVSSVEFCKHVKFNYKDDRKDNPTGTQDQAGPAGADITIPGPAGPAGPAGADSTVPGPAGADSIVPGPAGPAGADNTVPGPAGPNQISSTNLYRVVGNFVTASPSSGTPIISSTAICATGDVVIEGGYQLLAASSTPVSYTHLTLPTILLV